MKIFTFTKLWRALLLLTAVVAVGLSGCGGNNNPSGGEGGDNSSGGGGGLGGDITGDWLMLSMTVNGNTTVPDTSIFGQVYRYKSSGELCTVILSVNNNTGSCWVQGESCTQTWRTVGSTLYTGARINDSDMEFQYQYTISNNKYTVWLDSNEPYVIIAIKIDFDSWKRSHHCP
ncbi:MAG: hypothetical protein LBC59_03690 [Chitinispirillales bacterium]|jgi:hypothetical protein|nr:hypothetical protein [Chitinispirillales bacterium]